MYLSFHAVTQGAPPMVSGSVRCCTSKARVSGSWRSQWRSGIYQLRSVYEVLCFWGLTWIKLLGLARLFQGHFLGLAVLVPAKGISPPSQKDEFFLAISIPICVRVIFSGDPLVDQYVWLILAETVKMHSLTRPPTSFSCRVSPLATS